MILRCTNPDCESRKDETPYFDVNIVVDQDGDGNSREVAGKFHTCCYCQSDAEWIHPQNLSTECAHAHQA